MSRQKQAREVRDLEDCRSTEREDLRCHKELDLARREMKSLAWRLSLRALLCLVQYRESWHIPGEPNRLECVQRLVHGCRVDAWEAKVDVSFCVGHVNMELNMAGYLLFRSI